jgi:hypothetical protein
MANHCSLFGEYLNRIGAREVPSLLLPEEHAPDLSTVSSSRPADLVHSLDLCDLASFGVPSGAGGFRFFIDGVQRTIMLRILDMDLARGTTLQVPIHGVHLVAGAMQRCGLTLQPYLVRSVKVLLLPFYALREVDTVRFAEPPGVELHPDIIGFIYPELISGRNVLSDTAVLLEQGRRSRLSGADLLRVGELRRRALNRAKVLLRILELGLLEEVRMSTADDILVDGPIGPMFKYYGSIVSQGLKDVSSLKSENAPSSFDFLSRMAGAVKNVMIIPQEGLSVVLDPSRVRIPVFRFSDVLRADESASIDDEVYKAVFCAFVRLRPEVPGLWSPIAGLTRLDIPAPVVLDSDRRARENWVDEVVNQEGQIALLSSEIIRLQKIVGAYLSLRWPLPGMFGGRAYTELYAIAETERWLRSQLLHPYELRRQLTE